MAFPTTSLFARYEALLDTGKTNGQIMTSLLDFSGNGYNLFQAETAQTYNTNIINGKPAYYFAGNGAYVATDSTYTAFNSSDAQCTISIVLSSNNPGGSRTWPFGTTYAASTSIFAFTDGASSGKWGAFLRGASNAGQIYYTTSDDTLWSVLTLVYDGSTIKSYMNGTEIDSKSASGNQNMNTIAVGKIVGQTWEGYIAAAYLWKKGLDSAERAALHSYVQDTYGISVSDYTPSIARMKVWNGSWTKKPAKVWTGSQWKESQPKVWDGSSWILPE